MSEVLNNQFVCVQNDSYYNPKMEEWIRSAFQIPGVGWPTYAVVDADRQCKLKGTARDSAGFLEFLSKSKLDLPLIAKLQDKGDVDGLKKLMQSVVEDKHCNIGFIIGRFKRPSNGGALKVNCVWPERAEFQSLNSKTMPKSGVLLMESGKDIGTLTSPGFEQIRLTAVANTHQVEVRDFELKPLNPKHAATISGVVSLDDGKPAAKAQVYVRGSGDTICDQSGKFQIKGLAPGKFWIYSLLSVSDCVYYTQVDTIVLPGEHKILNIKMKPLFPKKKPWSWIPWLNQ